MTENTAGHSEVLHYLERLVELTKQNHAALKEGRHVDLLVNTAATDEVLAELEQLGLVDHVLPPGEDTMVQGSYNAESVGKMVALVDELHRLTDTNRKLAQERLAENAVLMELVQNAASPTYAHDKKSVVHKVLRHVLDLQA